MNFIIEHDPNLIVSPPPNNDKDSTSIATSTSSLTSSSTLMPTAHSMIQEFKNEINMKKNDLLTKDNLIHNFPIGVAQEIKTVMSIIVIWSQRQAKETFDKYLNHKNKNGLDEHPFKKTSSQNW